MVINVHTGYCTLLVKLYMLKSRVLCLEAICFYFPKTNVPNGKQQNQKITDENCIFIQKYCISAVTSDLSR